jgi:hypothetical protein
MIKLVPVSYCDIVGAFDKGDINLINELWDYNLRQGYFSITGCKHSPKCRHMTVEEEERFIEFTKERRAVVKAQRDKSVK